MSPVYCGACFACSIEFDRDCDYFAIAGVTKKIKVGAGRFVLYFLGGTLCRLVSVFDNLSFHVKSTFE